MKRILKIAGIVIGLVVILVVVSVASIFMGRQAISDGFEANGIRVVKDGFVSAAVVPIGQGQVALVDTGNDSNGKAILAELGRRQLNPEAVKVILLTHGHPDHVAGVHLFPNAQVMSLETEVALAEGRTAAHGPLTRLFPAKPTGVKITRPLHDGESFLIGDSQVPVRVYAVPGHTGGSAAYLIKSVLLIGDAADATADGKVKASPWAFSDDQAEDRASLANLDQRLLREGADIKIIEFAHSGVLTQGLAPLTTFAQQNR